MPGDPASATSAAGGSASRVPLPRVSTTWLFGLAALVVAGAIAAALFGLPVRTWFDQDSELQALEHELTEMQSVNHDLQGEVDRLQTDDGIREAAREELGHVRGRRQPPDDARASAAAHRPSRRVAVLAGRGDPRRARRRRRPADQRRRASTTVAPSTTAAAPTTTRTNDRRAAPTTTAAAPTTTAARDVDDRRSLSGGLG